MKGSRWSKKPETSQYSLWTNPVYTKKTWKKKRSLEEEGTNINFLYFWKNLYCGLSGGVSKFDLGMSNVEP